jgi:integral membrane protein (TIGR01906 family)
MMLRQVARWGEVTAVSMVWAAAVVGSAVLLMLLPVYTSAASQALGIPATAGLSRSDALRLSSQVRSLVSDSRFAPLPATWRGRPGFDEPAVEHLLDVRAVLHVARIVTGAAALVLALYVAYCLARRRTRRLRAGMLGGALLVVALVVISAIVALGDFDAFFAWFHSLFFRAGTWTFPADSLLIRLFPERFWEASGAVLAALSLLGGATLAIAARLLRVNASRQLLH